MSALARNSVLFGAALLVGAAIAACGEEGQDIGDNQCAPLPLYTWTYDPGTKQWTLVAVGGGPVSTANIDQDESDLPTRSGRCTTPVGSALSLNAGGAPASTGGTGGKSGTGGTSGKDAGKD